MLPEPIPRFMGIRPLFLFGTHNISENPTRDPPIKERRYYIIGYIIYDVSSIYWKYSGHNHLIYKLFNS